MRYLHTMVRVRDVEQSLDFYCNKLGLVEMRRKDVPEGRFTLIFLAAPKDQADSSAHNAPELELTYNWDTDSYDIGSGYGHIAIGVADIYATCADIREKGGHITREPGPMKHGTTVLAFATDPDGYKIELLERD